MNQPTDSTYRRWRWQIFIITWLAYAGFYLTRKSFAVAKIGIQRDPSLGWTDHQLAWIDGAYLTAYAVGQFLFGMAGDRLGTRIVVGAGMFFSVIAGFAMGASTAILLFGAFFLIQGLCQASGWGPLAKNISTFFSRRERGSVMGIWCTNYSLGAFVASIIVGYAGQWFGWRYAFFIPAAMLLGIWVLFLLLQARQARRRGARADRSASQRSAGRDRVG
jgi:OPA family sugar phosphate sensor protein UhpC-like MFS transporter